MRVKKRREGNDAPKQFFFRSVLFDLQVMYLLQNIWLNTSYVYALNYVPQNIRLPGIAREGKTQSAKPISVWGRMFGFLFS